MALLDLLDVLAACHLDGWKPLYEVNEMINVKYWRDGYQGATVEFFLVVVSDIEALFLLRSLLSPRLPLSEPVTDLIQSCFSFK